MQKLTSMKGVWELPSGVMVFKDDVFVGYCESVRSKAGVALQIICKKEEEMSLLSLTEESLLQHNYSILAN